MISVSGYVDVERIGRGGLGDVYRATRVSTGGTVAIKVLRDISDQSVAWHRTRRELTALVSLAGHANVVQLVEVLDLPEGPALIMEHAPGGSVADLLALRDRPLDIAETVLIGRHAASALVAAHAAGIVHRDVKPQNLLIDAYGQVKLCDFGIAAMARSDDFRDRTSAISMRYASPEDLNDDADVGPAADVYSLGATMLHLARGAPPTLKERLAPWVPPASDDEHVGALDAVIAACLHPVPAQRPTAAQVVDDLERLDWSLIDRRRSLTIEPTGTARTDDDEADGDDAVTADRPVPTSTVRNDAVQNDAAGIVDRTEARPYPAAPVTPLDSTVARPAPAARPTPARVSRRTRLAMGAVAVVVLGVVIALIASSTSDAPSILIVDRPSGLAAITELDWPVGPVGECLVQGDAAMEPTACTEPHDLQRFAVAELDPTTFPPDAPYDRDTVHGAVRAACSTAFEAFVGVPLTDSELEAPFSAPSSDRWTGEDRTYQCLVGVNGRRVIGDAADSRR